MDMEKMRKWLDLAQQFQQGNFWESVFDNGHTEKIMEQLLKTSISKPSDVQYPHVDIYKSNYELIIIMDLPGVRKEDIDISITDNALNVQGFSNRGYSDMIKVQTERHDGAFERTIALPEKIGPGAKISAKFNNGTIEIRIPRSNRIKEKIKIE